MSDVTDEFADRPFLGQGEIDRLELPSGVPPASGDPAPRTVGAALTLVDVAVNFPRKRFGRELVYDFPR
jgi:hypothetical protein